MQNLKEAERVNVIYNLSKGLSVQRSDGSDTLSQEKNANGVVRVHECLFLLQVIQEKCKYVRVHLRECSLTRMVLPPSPTPPSPTIVLHL